MLTKLSLAQPSKPTGSRASAKGSRTALAVGQIYLDVRHRRVHYLNSAARQLHDEGVPFTPAELARQPLQRLDGKAVAVSDLPLVIACRQRRTVEATFVWTSLSRPPCQVSWSAAPFTDRTGQVTGVLASVWCTPPEPDWQAVAGLAHDLATPLNALGLTLAMLEQPGIPEADRQALLDSLRAAIDRALQVGKDLLAWCRNPARRMRGVEPTWIPLGTFLSALANEQIQAARRKGLALSADLEAVQGWEVYTDRVRLGRLLANLLVNAVRYTHSGQVAFTAAWREEPGERALVLSVIDTGAGISQEEQESIFQPFERGRAGKDDDSGGSGLGLAVVDRLVEELGLALEVYSEYGRGSAFHLVLPERLIRRVNPEDTMPLESNHAP